MKNFYEKTIVIAPSLCDAEGKLSYHQAFNLFMDLADEHAETLGVAFKQISQRNLFWLTVKTKAVFEGRPSMYQEVTLSTWVEEPTKLRGDRSYEMRVGDTLLIRAKTEWAVLNTETKKLIPIGDVYPEGLPYNRPSACPEGFARVKDHFEEADKYAEYTVRSTDIDIGGHMNNVRYVQALLGTFSNKALQENPPKSFDVIFRNSVFEGNALDFYKQPGLTGGTDIKVSAGDMTALLVHME